MAGEYDVEVNGLAAFRRDVKRLDPAVAKELQGELKDAAGRVLDEARAGAPRRTGALAASLRVSLTTRGASIYSRLPYAPVVHWGGTIRPRGAAITFPRTEFVTRAAHDNAERLLEDVGDAVERAATRTGWH